MNLGLIISVFFSLNLSATFASATDYATQHCEQSVYSGSTVPFNDRGEFLEECAPEVLYSWWAPERVKAFFDQATDEKKESIAFKRMIYSWRTPLGTFGYGGPDGISLRIKLKKNVKFLFFTDLLSKDSPECRDDQIDTVNVYYNPYVTYSEYVICSSNVIDSLSLGQSEHLNEMLREKEWIETHSSKDFDRFVRYKNLGEVKKWADEYKIDFSQYFLPYAIDFRKDDPTGTDWYRSGLERKLGNMKKRVDQKNGQIFYESEASRKSADHFDIRIKNYFNSP